MLLLPKFDYEEPKSLREALLLFSELKGKARIIAGGTDLLVNMKKGAVAPGYLVSLRRIDPLREVKMKKTTVGVVFTKLQVTDGLPVTVR